LAWIGLSLLIYRRLTDARVRAIGSRADIVLLIALWLQIALGMSTIPMSIHHLDGAMMLRLTGYAQGVAIFDFEAWRALIGVHPITLAHIALGFVILFALPFTRLVHAISGLGLGGYLLRPFQIVRGEPTGGEVIARPRTSFRNGGY
jgi:nitrate reductase gamma subunit